MGREIANHILSVGGVSPFDKTHQELGCCPFVAAVHKWYEIYRALPGLVYDASIGYESNLVKLYDARSIAINMDHGFRELENIINIGLNNPEYSCNTAPVANTFNTRKGLTLVNE